MLLVLWVMGKKFGMSLDAFAMEYIPKPRDGHHQASWEAFLGEDSEYMSDMSMGENSNNTTGLLPNSAAYPQSGMPNGVESSSSEPSK
ncbi:hypothetical protein MKW98_001846, partial [Papaver atlanticum]